MGKVWAIIEIIKGVISLISQLTSMLKLKRRKDAEEKQKELEKAVDDSKVAQTDQEVLNAQNSVIDNKP
jgi:uncharacterized membrane protein YcjF (UPF0283 family)